MTTEIKTVSLLDQLRASRAIYEKALENLENLSDSALSRILDLTGRASTVDRVLGIASASTVARVLGIASDDTVARVLGIASASTVDRVLGIASASTVDRVLGIASDDTVDRVLGIASDDTVARVLGIASASTVDRVLGIASDDTVDRITFVKALQVPVVPDLDKRVAEAAEAGNLDMSTWHCGTTHCRAGWAVVFGGEAGAKLEKELGSEMAGRLIYEASTGRPAPDFFAGQDSALEDIRRCAAEAQ